MGRNQQSKDATALHETTRQLQNCRSKLEQERELVRSLRDEKEEASKAEPAGPLSRSSLEAYTGIVIGIVLAVLPMTYWLRAILFFILLVVCADFTWRSPFTYRWPYLVKTLAVAVVMPGLGWVAYGNVSKAYQDSEFPPDAKYIIYYGGPKSARYF